MALVLFGARLATPRIQKTEEISKASALASMFSSLSTGNIMEIPPGTYGISSPLTISGLRNFVIHCQSQTSLVAQAGMQGKPIMHLTDVMNARIQGCTFNGNNEAHNGVLVDGASSDVAIADNECFGTTGLNADCISLIGATNELAMLPIERGQILNNRVHDIGGTGSVAISLRNTEDVEVSGNKIYGMGATNGNGIGTGGTFRSDIRDNYLSMFAPGMVLISGFRNFEWSVRGNQVHGTIGRGVYCDTCYGSLTEGNTFDGNAMGIEDEVNAYSQVIGNIFEKPTSDNWPSIEIAGREGVDQVLLDNGDQAWTCSPNVDCTVDETDKRVGKSSIKMAIRAGFTRGVVGYAATAVHNVDVSSYLFIRLWIKSDKTIERGSLVVRISSNENLSDTVDEETLPVLVANHWEQVYVPMRVYWNAPGMRRINSVGIAALAHITPMTLHVDDIEVENREMKESVSDNQIKAGAIGIDFLQTTYNCDAINNTIMDVGWWGTARGAAGISDVDATHPSRNLLIAHNIIHSATSISGSVLNVGIDDRGTDTHVMFNNVVGFFPGRDLVARGVGRVMIGNTE